MQGSKNFRRGLRHGRALAGVLACLSLAYLLYHSLAGGTLLDHNIYDSYALQAENWLAGCNYIQNGQNYSWLELAIYQGRYYQSFPPVPAVLLLPWVVACGGYGAVPSNLVALLLALGVCCAVYACFWQAGALPRTAAFFAVFVSLGSNLFWMGGSGGVWFMAQLSGLFFALWGMFFALRPRQSAAARALASLCLALAVGCRPFYALLALLWGLGQLLQAVRQRRLLSLLPAAVPAALVAAALMAYNYARFGSVLEFGHNYLPEFMRAENGQFSLSYLLPNLQLLFRPITLDADLQLQFPNFNGFLFLAADPLFLLVLLCGLQALRQPKALPVRRLALPTAGPVLLACCCLALAVTCAHRTLGGWQFGARYLVDLFPYVLLWFLGRQPHWRPRAGALTLCGLAVLFNLYGAVYMLTA